MPNTREKLIELIRMPIKIIPDAVVSPHITFTLPYAEDLADRLIANGVIISKMETVATDNNKWIPVTERLPENDCKVFAIVKEKEGYNRFAFVFYSDRRWWDLFYDGFHNINVTYWMPLPEPPKGE